MSSIKIAITGPESTGKSSISKFIAQYYGALLIEEFAREYLEKLNRPYTKEDLDLIANHQFQKLQEAINSRAKLIVSDTEMTVMKIWSAYKFGEVSPLITQHLQNQEFDIYFLMDIDLEWQYDPLREHPQPEMRRYFMDCYIKEMLLMSRNFYIISGNQNQRQNQVTKLIDQLINKRLNG